MKKAEKPTNEKERLETLHSYQVLDTPPEEGFDDYTLLASKICETPIALVSLVDDDRQWFKSKHGIDVSQTPRDVAYCAHAILQDDVFIVKDALQDDRFHDNPLATGEPPVRFYAGAPLRTLAGHNIGTLCVIDHHPRELSKDQIEALTALSRRVIVQFEYRLALMKFRDDLVKYRKIEKQLNKANRKSEAASRAKSNFLANMSHEIRTPMNGVLGAAQLLADEPLNSKQKRYISTILSSGFAMLEILNDILDYSKIEAGLLSLDPQDFDLHELLISVCNLYEHSAAEKANFLALDKEPQLPKWIHSDAGRLRQILSNLLSNAVKFTSNGKIIVHAGLNTEANKLVFEVEDSGKGISNEKQQDIFDKFSQEDVSITREYGGTGLGLAICKELVSMLGGSIKLDSQKGQGSRFTFTIDFEPARHTHEKEATPKPNLTAPKIANLKALLVEDQPINRDIACAFMKKIDLHPDIATNGQEAVEAVQNMQYDILFMDCQMPVLDGFEASRQIRALPLSKQPVIIAMTAHAMKDDRQRCLDAGMDDYIPKPLSKSKLLDAITRWNSRLYSDQPEGIVLPTSLLRENVDSEKLITHFGGDKHLLISTLEKVIADITRLETELIDSMTAQNQKAIEVTARTLRKTLENLHAPETTELLKKTEAAATKGQLLKDHMKLQDLIANVRSQLSEIIDKLNWAA